MKGSEVTIEAHRYIKSMRDHALIAFLKHIFRLAIPAFFRFTDERNICKPEEG